MREVLDVVRKFQKAHQRLVWVYGEIKLVFYTNNGRIAGRDHKWVQDPLMVTVVMFHRMGIKTNLEKTKSMVFMPGFIRGKWGDQAYKWRATGEGATFRERKRFRQNAPSEA